MMVSQPTPAAGSTHSLTSASAAPPGLMRGVARSSSGRFGLVLAVLVLSVIAFGRFLTPHDPLEINLAAPFSSPSATHILGTDGLGRDVLSRLLTGGDRLLIIPLCAVALSYLLGGGLGFLAVYRGGRFDAVVRRVFDLLISMPVLLLALVAVAALGPSFWVLVMVIVLADTPRAGRTVRAAIGGQVALDYVQVARARGDSALSILFREIAPNVVAPVASDLALRTTYAIIAIATLSFLGLGTQPPDPDWGLMINEARGAISFSPIAVIAPAVALALLSISFNLIAEAMTEHVAGSSAGVGIDE